MRTRFALALSLALASLCTALAQPRSLEVWHVFSLEADMIYAGLESYQQAHPDVRLEVRVLPFAELRTELVRAVATANVPDLVTIDNPELASFAAQDALEELSDLVEASDVISPELYHPGPWSTVVWGDGVYGVPRDSNTLALYYNVDMFEAAGLDPDAPPSTWAELTAAAETLTDPSRNVFGIAFSAIQSEEATFQWLPILYQAGGSLEDLTSTEAMAALDFWADLVRRGYATRDVVTQRQYEAMNTFIAQSTAMVISGPWELPRLSAEATFEWRLALLPVKEDVGVRASALGGFNWAIPIGAENREGAFELIEWMSQVDIMKDSWVTGRLSPRIDTEVPDPAYPQAFAVYSEQMGSATARGPHPQWPEISRAIQTAIQEALTGVATTEQALERAAGVVTPILERQPLR